MRSTRVTLCLIAFALFFYVAQGAMVTFTNNCPYTVWPGTLSANGNPQLSTTGFMLLRGLSFSMSLPSPCSGRFWGRTGCSDKNGKLVCATGDCASGIIACKGAGAILPASFVEIAVTSGGGQDFYNINHVDGYNLPISVTPQGSGISGSCKTTSCRNDINKVCPVELQVKSRNGIVVACKSACMAFNRPEYCCTGDFNTPQKCSLTYYSRIFKEQCPNARSYAFDDASTTFSCPSGTNYLITFCPL